MKPNTTIQCKIDEGKEGGQRSRRNEELAMDVGQGLAKDDEKLTNNRIEKQKEIK